MDANERQVGGSHYGLSNLQHWDLSRIFNWDPMQYQIIKYVMRWKQKGATPGERKKDLLKAQHFLEKYLEDFEVFDERAHPGDYAKKEADECSKGGLPAYKEPEQLTPPTDFEMKKFTDVEGRVWQNEGYYGDGTSLWKCMACRETFRTSVAPVPHNCQPKQRTS